MSNENGIRQSPFSDAWPTPDVGGTGLNGMGAGFDPGPGGSGLIQSPFSQAHPAPGIEGIGCADLGGQPPDTIQVDGGNPKGSQLPWDAPHIQNTIDRK